MPSKNEETKLQTDPSDQQNKILSELQQPPQQLPLPLQPAEEEPQKQNPVLENRRDDSDSITAATATAAARDPSMDSIIINDLHNSFSFLDYDPMILNAGAQEEEEFDDEDEELRSYDAEEVFFTKFLNQKYITRGYKRQPVKNKALRAETRRKYQHFRQVQKKEDEKHRKNEKYTYDCLPPPFSNSSPNTTTTSSPLSQIGSSENGSNPATTTTTTSSSPPIGNTPAAATTTPDSDAAAAAAAAKYLTLQAERDYLEAVRQSSVDLTPTTGLSMQQMLDMCNRDLTPEDYDLLLRLDEAVAKKTVKQETLTNLMEQIIDKEAQLAEVCTVCMFNYELGDRAKYLPCNHFFHVDCIVPYLSSYGQSCPVCKSKV